MEIVNFLLRLKGEREEMVGLFPFLNFIVTNLPQSKISVILDEENIYPSEWFFNNVKIYNIPRNKSEGVFGVHHFAANLHEVFNVDYFFDFINDFHSAFIGLAFKAKKKIGLAGGPKSYFYSHTIPSFNEMCCDQKFFDVLQFVDELKNATPFSIDIRPKKEFGRVLLDLTNFKDDLFLQRMIEVAKIIELPKLLYIPKESLDDFEHDLNEHIKELKNLGEFYSEPASKFIENLDHFDILVTDNSLVAQFAQLKTVMPILISNIDTHLSSVKYMSRYIVEAKFDNTELVKYGINEEKEIRIPSELFDYLLSYFDLRLAP